MLRALDMKLVRDLWRMKAQAASIALVVASGVALLVMSLSTYEALRDSADAYYERYRFGQVFAAVKRAPLHLEARIKAIPGVQNVQLRISKQAVLDIERFPEPLMGRLVSIPEGRQPLLNRLVLQRGRLVAPGRPDEVVINESFAVQHELKPGDTIAAIIDDSKRELRIVGTAMSPEFIYVINPFALIPDKKRYGILWIGRQALEAAYDYEGAFNELALTVTRGTDTRRIVQVLDTLLAPYGAVGAIDRKDHLSAWFVENELKQNQTSARILPSIFLLVAAFLTSTVLARLIATERGEIGLMKAFGYSNTQVGWHYLKLVLAIIVFGILFGWLLGAALGRLSTESYIQNLNFPLLIYRPGPTSFLIGAVASLVVALLATARAVREAARMSPIVAMNPPAPPSYQIGTLLPAGLAATLDEPTRIVFRQIRRWPGRALLTVLGFAGALAMMVLSLQFFDAIDEIARTHFDEVQREDVALGFSNPQATTVLHEISRLPGVLMAEPMRIVAADLSAGHRRHRGSLHGLPDGAALARIFDVRRGELPTPQHGVVLAERLAEKLKVRVGDEILVEVLEGRRPTGVVRVADIYASHIGMFAFLGLDELNRMLGDRPVAEYVNTIVDEARLGELVSRLKDLPSVSTVAIKSAAIANFNETVAGMLTIFVGFFSLFSFALGFGVTYNAQRIALSERGRELATLRVLGYSRHDALYVLLGETLVLVLVALPLGCLFGWVLTALFVNASGFQTELMRIPLAIKPTTYGVAVCIMLFASLASGLAMKLRVDRLDLISVLKTRE